MKKAISISLCVFMGLIVVAFYKNCYGIKLHATTMSGGSDVFCWSYRWTTVFFIIGYLVCIVGLVGLIAFEFLGFWANGRKIFFPAEYIYYKMEGFQFSKGVAIILLCQFLWGLYFIKLSCKYCLI